MQRKRRNINFGNFSKSPGKYQKKFNNSITNTTLHGIPTVRMSKSNKKFLVAKRNPFCGINELYTNDNADIYQPTSVVWWRSAHLKNALLRSFLRASFRKRKQVFFSLNSYAVRTRASHVIMTPLSRLARYPKYVAKHINQALTIPFGGIKRSAENVIHTCASHAVMTPLSRIGAYLKFPLYIICTLLLSFVVNSMMSGSECYAAVNPTASLSVSNPTLSTTVAPGDTAYLSSNVTYSASDIDSYTLQVTYANGYNSLKLDGGTTTLTGANGASGSSLANNSWGFAWTNNTTNNTSTNAGLTYYTVPSYGTNGSGLSTGRLESVTLPANANNTLSSTTKRIVFAAKFAENNTNSGHYKTGVQLSMVATPRKMTLGDITKMQDMYGNYSICTNTPLLSGQKYSAEYTLTDDRTYPSGTNKTYKVRKFADGRCWMTENLRIYNTTINSNTSDFTSGSIALPNSTKSDFTDANKFTYRSGLFSEANSGSTGYYNWYTATAGAGNSSFTTNNQSVNTSICPKGWTLPTGGTAGNANTENTWSNFYKLFRNMGLTISTSSLSTTGSTSWGSGDLNTVQNATDSNSKVIYNFKYTGYVYNGSLNYGTDRGYWWSSTAYSARSAYGLSIYSSYVYPGTVAFYRYFGIAVRCIARDS